MEKVIEIRKLSVKAGKKQILKEVTLDIYRNRINTIVGPSGGGKSTLLRSLNRLAELDPHFVISGEILFNGKDVRKYSDIEIRRQIGMVFQRPNPFPMSVYDNVAFGIRLQGNVKKDKLDKMVEESLKEAGLWDEVKDDLRRSAFTLSGGQQQRLCIARALILRPEVLMMDEPTSSLDPAAKAKVEDLMIDLKEKYTVVLVTHDISQARKVSDSTAMIYNGKIVATGEGRDLLEKSSSESVKSFLGSVKA